MAHRGHLGRPSLEGHYGRAMPKGLCVIALVIAIAGCSTDVFQPPQSTAATTTEEARLSVLVADSQRSGFSGARGACAVRLLGSQGRTSFAWAECRFPGLGGAPEGGLSVPVRVDGNTVRLPGDADRFAADVRDLFPKAMVDAILHHPDRLRPRS